MINQITIIGLGIIGKSIASAIRQSDFTKSIVAFDQDQSRQDACFTQGLIDHSPISFTAAVKSADLVVIAVPYSEYEQVFADIALHAKPQVVITDTASIKQPIIELAKATLGVHSINFIPSHPVINISDNHQAPQPDLFADRPIIITPDDDSNLRAIEIVQLFWEKMGGEIESMSSKENDTLLASTCHLPQLLAFTFINSVKNKDTIQRYITKNFKDFTSIATHSPILWRDLCIANRQAILKEIVDFEVNLKKMKKILEAEETDILLEHFSDAKQMRENL